LSFIASQLISKEETEHLEKIFKAIDADGNGNLDKQEILNGYEEHFGIPISEEEVDKMFKEIDIDGNGTIDYSEFVMATMNEKNLLSNENLQ
jgi:calcium-dependent protein kinase